jgi:hypothetical protein
VGQNGGSITASYATGSVIGDTLPGGLVGDGLASNVYSSFWDIETSGQPTSGGGTGKTTAEMQQQSTFVDWDFFGSVADGTEDIWTIGPRRYPMLTWEGFAYPDLNGDDKVDFCDFAVFWDAMWTGRGSAEYNPACDIAFPRNNSIDMLDLAAFMDRFPLRPPPAQVTFPIPFDGATNVARYAELSWTAGADATSHDIYFGTSNPPAFVGNQDSTVFQPEFMAENTTYYWRVDQVNAWGTTTGAAWTFTTGSGGTR